MSTLASKNVLITGASRGLGLALAHAFASRGARLFLLARDESALRAARAQIRGSTAAEVDIAVCDLRDAAQVERVAAELLERCGQIDILINNAGIIQPGRSEHKPVSEYAEAMAVHFWAPLNLMRAVIPSMKRHGGGNIVNVSSVEGKIAFPHIAPYCASKFALTGLSNALRAELARDGIYITTVCPGLLRSKLRETSAGAARGYPWLSSRAALPLVSTSYERAADRIVRACVRGRRWLELDLITRLLICADALAPSAFGAVMERINELLLEAPHS